MLSFLSYYRGVQSTALALHDTLFREEDKLFPKVHGTLTHLINIISRSLIRFDRFDEAEQLMREGLSLPKKYIRNKTAITWDGLTNG